jgi:hypothetical protein
MLPVLRVISALTMKMPEPIMLPATIIVASRSPSVGLKEVAFIKIFIINKSCLTQVNAIGLVQQ